MKLPLLKSKEKTDKPKQTRRVRKSDISPREAMKQRNEEYRKRIRNSKHRMI